MKKIININFHGRVIPIEETAYEILQQYIESLRKYFANEEGRDEIINDIENRFAELFSECLKKGATCITDMDVNTIITSMGRPEDFEQEEMSQASPAAGAGSREQQSSSSQQQSSSQYTTEPRRLYRSENDKILGGVCAGLANYLRLDPAIVRILFALITFGAFGLGFIVYIILWVVVPPKSLAVNVRKRLYRNSEDRVIAGVASGLAAYFHIEVWIPRLIFALPLIVGVLTSIIRRAWWFNHDPGPLFFTGGFGGTLFISYIILWIVLPEAVSASEKLEMRGEKVDLESIKNTIKGDLENFKGRAKEMGTEMKDRFQQVGEEMAPIARKAGSGIGHAIGVLFKAFFLFIAGIIAFALLMALIGLIFGGAGALTFKNYILTGFWQNFLAWTSFILFLVIPVVALLTWLIRRITGVRSRSHYLGYVFATLWIIGLFCFISLVGVVFNNFRYRQHVEENMTLSSPAHGKLLIRTTDGKTNYGDNDDWFDYNWENNGIFYNLTEDSMTMNTIRVNLMKSPDSDYHVQLVKFSRGNNPRIAKELASRIVFPIRQVDSILYMPHGFTVSRDQRFRNQQILVAVAIPVGKHILVDRNIEDYHWFNIDFNRRHFRWDNRRNNDWNDGGGDYNDWGNSYSWSGNVEYVMTRDGLSRTDKKKTITDEEDNGDDKQRKDGDGYRYRRHKTDTIRPGIQKKDSATIKATALQSESDHPIYLLSALFQ